MKLLKDNERWIRNSLLSDDVDKRKSITSAWHKCYKPLKKWGLGLRSLISFNKVSKLKLFWEFLSHDSSWGKILKARVLSNDMPINNNILSSIWSGMKDQNSSIMDKYSWLIGNGREASFWLDHWCGSNLAYRFNIPLMYHKHLKVKVSS